MQDPSNNVGDLNKENDRLKRQLTRYQALYTSATNKLQKMRQEQPKQEVIERSIPLLDTHTFQTIKRNSDIFYAKSYVYYYDMKELTLYVSKKEGSSLLPPLSLNPQLLCSGIIDDKLFFNKQIANTQGSYELFQAEVISEQLVLTSLTTVNNIQLLEGQPYYLTDNSLKNFHAEELLSDIRLSTISDDNCTIMYHNQSIFVITTSQDFSSYDHSNCYVVRIKEKYQSEFESNNIFVSNSSNIIAYFGLFKMERYSGYSTEDEDFEDEEYFENNTIEEELNEEEENFENISDRYSDDKRILSILRITEVSGVGECIDVKIEIKTPNNEVTTINLENVQWIKEEDTKIIIPSTRSIYKFSDNFTFRWIGRGLFGVVFKSREKVEQYDFAVKEIKNCRIKDREMYYKEIIRMRQLNHHAVVRYFFYWIEYDDTLDERERTFSFFIKMELCSYSLENWWAKWDDVDPSHTSHEKLRRKWIRHLAAGLAHVHINRISHKDLNDKNIFIVQRKNADGVESAMCEDNEIKIGDFGLSSGEKNPATMEEENAKEKRNDVVALAPIILKLCIGKEEGIKLVRSQINSKETLMGSKELLQLVNRMRNPAIRLTSGEVLKQLQRIYEDEKWEMPSIEYEEEVEEQGIEGNHVDNIREEVMEGLSAMWTIISHIFITHVPFVLFMLVSKSHSRK